MIFNINLRRSNLLDFFTDTDDSSDTYRNSAELLPPPVSGPKSLPGGRESKNGSRVRGDSFAENVSFSASPDESLLYRSILEIPRSCLLARNKERKVNGRERRNEKEQKRIEGATDIISDGYYSPHIRA